MQRKKEFYSSLVGLRVGDATVIRILRTEKRVGKIWECRCNCGNTFETLTNKIVSGTAKHCPECSREQSSMRAKKQLTKHGLHNSPLYLRWRSMISRCNYKGDTNYKHYGGRGIRVCEEWENDFKSFYNWARANGYGERLTIDRIDNSKGYSPDNCRWITQKEQCSNRRSTKHITVDGVTKTQSEWADAIGVSGTAIIQARKNGTPDHEYIRNRLANAEALERGRHQAEVFIY